MDFHSYVEMDDVKELSKLLKRKDLSKVSDDINNLEYCSVYGL